MESVRERTILELLDPNNPTPSKAFEQPKPTPTLAQYITGLLSKRKLCVAEAVCGEQRSGRDGRISCVKRKTCGKKKHATVAQVCRKAGIDNAYGNQIFNGTAKNPHRDYIIRLAFGFEMNYNETQELLRIADKSELCANDVARDNVIVRALGCDYSLDSIAATLYALELPMLKPQRNDEPGRNDENGRE